MRYTTIRFSQIEKHDLLRSWLLISLAFTIALQGFSFGLLFSLEFLVAILLAGLTVGIGFILHELSHKVVAIRYGCSAEYRANTFWLWLMIIMSFFGVIFAAPGAVYIQGSVSRKENGIISAAGPFANLVLAILFLGIVLGGTLSPGLAPLSTVAKYGLLVNAWLALFNMIPIFPFDGSKIWVWNKLTFFGMIVLAALLTFVPQYWFSTA